MAKEIRRPKPINNFVLFKIIFLLALFFMIVDFLNLYSNKKQTNHENFLMKIADMQKANDILNIKDCSIESCINFKKCPLNQRLSLFVFDNESNILKIDKHNYIDFKISIHFATEEHELNQTCLVVIFLKDINDMLYYVKLSKFLINHNINQINNLILIDISNQKETTTKKSFINFLTSTSFVKNLNDLELQVLVLNLARSMFSSNSYLKSNHYDNLFIHFSILNDELYFNEAKSIDGIIYSNQKLNQKRKYTITYHQTYSDFSNYRLEILKDLFSLFNKYKYKIDGSCSSDSISKNLCFNVDKRISLLLNSDFTLIIPDQDGYFWSSYLTYRLMEALRSSTIPVLIDADLKLPLDNFIAWDEIVIRIPFLRMNNLIQILSSIDQNEIMNRQIKARNVYNSYFSNIKNQFSTLVTVIHDKLGLPVVSLNHISIKTLREVSLQTQRNLMINESNLNLTNTNNLSSNSNFIEYFNNHNSINTTKNFLFYKNYFKNFLGDKKQYRISSDKYLYNYTQSKYLKWNKLYHPFNNFPSLPYNSYYHNPVNFPEKLEKIKLSFSNHVNTLNQSIEFNNSINEFFFGNFSYGGGDGRLFHNHLGGNFKHEQFTIVIYSLNNVDILMKNLETYLDIPYLNSILVLWNSDLKVSNEFKIKYETHFLSKRLRIFVSLEKKKTYRFSLINLIRTDAILNLDDGISLTKEEILFGFRVWRENRDRIVGYPARYHSWNFSVNNYIYQSDTTCEYSMILTGAAFYHKFYNYAFWYLMDERIRKKIDSVQTCEDIAFNMLVSHYTNKPPIKATSNLLFDCEEFQSSNLNKLYSSLNIRNECFNYFISIYGYNPLLYSQLRVDSVLYNTNLPHDKFKCFESI